MLPTRCSSSTMLKHRVTLPTPLSPTRRSKFYNRTVF
ncbi:hypothetical protein EVA_17085 [gut metagenome]|uniref:Uncharacterized protein n=1 Tax=gut metagenome TaxID=749906 RepID=J9G5L3_9ZZZZ